MGRRVAWLIPPVLLAVFLFAYWRTMPPPGSQAPPAPVESKLGVLVAFDAKDRFIGHAVRPFSAMGEAMVMLEASEQSVALLLRRDSFAHALGGVVYFSEPGCRGNPLIGADLHDESLGPPAAVAGDRETLYLATDSHTDLRRIASMLRGDVCESFAVEAWAFRARAVRNLADEFTPPYRVEQR